MDKFSVTRYFVAFPAPMNKFTVIGIDPGTANLGLAIISPWTTSIYQVGIQRQKDPIERMQLVRTVWRSLSFTLPYFFTVIIEGAAYARQFRQVELAEVRTVLAIELSRYQGADVRIVPPNVIRSKVFGHDHIKAKDQWKDLHNTSLEIIRHADDALEALGCAYYGLLVKEAENAERE